MTGPRKDESVTGHDHSVRAATTLSAATIAAREGKGGHPIRASGLGLPLIRVRIALNSKLLRADHNSISSQLREFPITRGFGQGGTLD